MLMSIKKEDIAILEKASLICKELYHNSQITFNDDASNIIFNAEVKKMEIALKSISDILNKKLK